jgi:thymidylate synthase
MNKLDKQYTDLLQTILDYGIDKKDRTGTGTKSIFGYTIRHNMKDGFPLLTTKRMPFRLIATELLWFLRGDTNIKFLVDNGCNIWNGDAYQNYLKGGDIKWLKSFGIPYSQEEFINKIKTDTEFAEHWGDLGPVYGKQWRNWGGKKEKYQQQRSYGGSFGGPTHVEYGELVEYDVLGIDQIANLINDLKTNPDSRRLMVNAWNVGELGSMILPPCHYGFQVYTRELSWAERVNLVGYVKTEDIHEDWLEKNNVPTRAISLMWNQRSVDTFLGLPFNIASYGLLLEIIAKAVNMVPDELIGNLGDTHLYLNHIEQAKEQIGRKFTEEEINEHLQQSGMDALMIDARARYIDSLPNKTREPYPLPSLKHLKTDDFYKSLSEDVSLFTHLDINDFMVEGYQSHPTIKAPLSN